MKTRVCEASTLAASLLAGPALADGKVSFKDPAGDDNGPGTYTYPTDAVYKRGSFDMTGSRRDEGQQDRLQRRPSTPPWRTPGGWATGSPRRWSSSSSTPTARRAAASRTALRASTSHSPRTTPGTSSSSSRRRRPRGGRRWRPRRRRARADIVIPEPRQGRRPDDHRLGGPDQLGGGDPSQWGYQVVVQSNEGFPAGKDLLTRKVNEYEGQHRFGGGTDSDCDPHVIDILAGNGTGDAEEQAQHEMLKYECNRGRHPQVEGHAQDGAPTSNAVPIHKTRLDRRGGSRPRGAIWPWRRGSHHVEEVSAEERAGARRRRGAAACGARASPRTARR